MKDNYFKVTVGNQFIASYAFCSDDERSIECAWQRACCHAKQLLGVARKHEPVRISVWDKTPWKLRINGWRRVPAVGECKLKNKREREPSDPRCQQLILL